MRLRSIVPFLGYMLAALPASADEENSKVLAPESAEAPVNVAGAVLFEFHSQPAHLDAWSALRPSWGPIFYLQISPIGIPNNCEKGRSSDDDELVHLLCEDLLANSRFSFQNGFGTGGRNGIIGVTKYPTEANSEEKEPDDKPMQAPALALVSVGDNDYLEYAAAEIPEHMQIALNEGNFDGTKLRYPARALRMALQGSVTVLLGVDSDGIVRECRPTQSSGNVFLDVQTCVQAQRWGRFVFYEPPAKDDGLRYFVKSIGWYLNGS